MKLKGQVTSEFLTSAIPPTWLIEGIIPTRSLTAIVSAPGIGKTWFAMEAALALATGTDFMGRFPCEQVRVLFIGEDSPDWDVAAQLRKMVHGRGLSHRELDDIVWVVKKGANLDDDSGAAQIAELIEHCQTPFVIIDNLREIHNLDEDKSYLMKQVTNRLDYIRTRTGAALLVLHHPRKGNGKLSPLLDMRGSGGLGGKLDGILGLKYLKRSDLYQVLVGKRRAMLMQDWTYRFTVSEDTALFTSTMELDEFEKAILERLGGECVPAKELVAAVAAISDSPFVEQRTHDAIARLRSACLIRRVSRGIYEKVVDTEPEIGYTASRKDAAAEPAA